MLVNLTSKSLYEIFQELYESWQERGLWDFLNFYAMVSYEDKSCTLVESRGRVDEIFWESILIFDVLVKREQ